MRWTLTEIGPCKLIHCHSKILYNPTEPCVVLVANGMTSFVSHGHWELPLAPQLRQARYFHFYTFMPFYVVDYRR